MIDFEAYQKWFLANAKRWGVTDDWLSKEQEIKDIRLEYWKQKGTIEVRPSNP